jgi:hypothetical protein
MVEQQRRRIADKSKYMEQFGIKNMRYSGGTHVNMDISSYFCPLLCNYVLECP